MKKFIKKYIEVISSPLFNIIFPIVGFPFLVLYIAYDNFHYHSAIFGAMVWFLLGLFCDGIDALIEKKKKAADQEKTGH